MPNIVSLIPSGTEMVCALGCYEQLKGRSHECDFPLSIGDLPICTAPNISVDGTSQEIHERVSGILRNALSVYRVEVETLRTLKPDIIVTQTQCDVCAVSFTDVERALKESLEYQPTLIPLQATNLQGLWDDLLRVAQGIGKEQEGRELLASYQRRILAISDRCRNESPKPSVACIEWMEPLMAAGNWVPELVELAGGLSVFGAPGAHAPWITWEALAEANPAMLILMPCGFSKPRIEAEMNTLTQNPVWPSLKAVQSGKVYLTDGNQFFNRPGPRLVESLEIFAEIFHPTSFQFGHTDTGWRQWHPAR
ncbi:MAG: cobalamin-binding protein [Nitrospirales bacterium]|nr:MAG: cobalamin-binding protein [Nitrospirales bacterium]